MRKSSIFILAIFITLALNIVLSPFSLRADLSKGHAYTLSKATKTAVKKATNPVDVRFYVSSDIPSKLIPLKNEVVDLLREYEKINNKIHISIFDPKKDQKASKEAEKYGLPQLQFSQLEQDKYAVTASYFGLVIVYDKQTAVIPQVANIGSLEYNITSAIYKLTQKQAGKIGVLGDSSLASQDPLGTLKSVLSQEFQVDPVSISTDSAGLISLDPSYKAIILLDDNQTIYDTNEIQALKNYVKAKGNLIFFVDGEWIDTQLGFQATPQQPQHNLSSLFKDFGITLNNDLVLSALNEVVTFNSNQGAYLTPYPFWLRTNSFDTGMSYFSNINQLTYPWASSLTLLNKKNIETTPLIYSTKQSWTQKGAFILDPQNIPMPKQNQLKQYIIAAQSSLTNGGKIIIIPSSRFVQDGYLSDNSDNVELVLNMVNDFVSQGALSGIRSRAVNFYPLPNVPDREKDLIKYLNILLLPGLFGIYGVWRLLRRK